MARCGEVFDEVARAGDEAELRNRAVRGRASPSSRVTQSASGRSCGGSGRGRGSIGTRSELRTDEVAVSRSMRMVGARCDRASAKWTAKVVFPTPPLPEATGIIRLGIEGLSLPAPDARPPRRPPCRLGSGGLS